MALIIKGICDITCSIFNGILHVILRDLTNYYWYIEEENQNDDISVNNQIDNNGDLLLPNLNDECNCLGSNQENIRPGFVNNSEREDGIMPNESLSAIYSLCSLNIDDNLDEIHSIEDNSMIKIEEDNLNSLTSPINQNCVWTEVENDLFENKNKTNKDKNIIEEEYPQIFLENLEKNSKAPLENVGLGMELGENLNLQINYNNCYDETNCNITFIESTGKEHALKICETEENLLNRDGERNIIKFQNGEKSVESSECELGLRSFQSQNVHDEWPVLEMSGGMSQINKMCESQLVPSKVSRYVHNTTLPTTKITKQPCSPDETSTLKTRTTLSFEGVENANLRPLTSYGINGTLPMLNKSQELTESEHNVTRKSKELQDDTSDISCAPGEKNQVGSVSSNDSWDDWFSRFSTIIRSKSPAKNHDAPLIEPSNETIENDKEDLCDCIKSHSCLLDVDSDDDLTKDLLTPEQLGSVETGSVSDWLYRVNPPYQLLPFTRQSEVNQKEIQIIEEQEQNTNIHSESSEEDLAVKKFFIEQWLDKTETYNNTGLNTKFIGSGDIM